MVYRLCLDEFFGKVNVQEQCVVVGVAGDVCFRMTGRGLMGMVRGARKGRVGGWEQRVEFFGQCVVAVRRARGRRWSRTASRLWRPVHQLGCFWNLVFALYLFTSCVGLVIVFELLLKGCTWLGRRMVCLCRLCEAWLDGHAEDEYLQV